jgi:polyisoprenoid-binding protein YceI
VKYVFSEAAVLHLNRGQTYCPEAATTRYLLDAKRSKFTVRAFAAGLLSAFGHNPIVAIPDFEGEATVDSDALEKSSLHLVIRAASLSVVNDMSDKDRNEMSRRMHDEALESSGYPEIVYDCSKLSASRTGDGQYWVALNGELSLHGVTCVQPISARVTLTGDTLRAAGEFSVLQSDYEIELISGAGGTIKLKDEIKLSFDMTANRQN